MCVRYLEMLVSVQKQAPALHLHLDSNDRKTLELGGGKEEVKTPSSSLVAGLAQSNYYFKVT